MTRPKNNNTPSSSYSNSAIAIVVAGSILGLFAMKSMLSSKSTPPKPIVTEKKQLAVLPKPKKSTDIQSKVQSSTKEVTPAVTTLKAESNTTLDAKAETINPLPTMNDLLQYLQEKEYDNFKKVVRDFTGDKNDTYALMCAVYTTTKDSTICEELVQHLQKHEFDINPPAAAGWFWNYEAIEAIAKKNGHEAIYNSFLPKASTTA